MRVPYPDTARRALVVLASTGVLPSRRRAAVLRRLGGTHLHPSLLIASDVHFARLDSLTVGPDCFINSSVYFDSGDVIFGSRVYVGFRAVFATLKHEIGGPEQRAAAGMHLPITVGDGTWIGANAVIMPGITIGPGCVIGAGAVVTRDCEPNGLYVGVPARRVRDLPVGPGAPAASS